MDIHLLRTFVAAYEEANFTKAARRLNATQPGVSVQVAALEAHVGTALFERNARSVTPTVAGRRLYPRALKLIHDFNSVTQEIRALAGAVSGRVAVGVPPLLSAALLSPVLTRHVAAYPECDVRIVEGHGESLLLQVERGELDVALVTRRVEDAGMAARHVGRDRIVLASGPLSGLNTSDPVRLDAEPKFKMVVPSMVRPALNGLLEEPLREGRIVPERLIELEGLACTLDFIAQTEWVALLPASSTSMESRNSRVRFNPIAGDDIALDYFVVRAHTVPLSVAAQSFVDLVEAELSRITLPWDVRSRRQRGSRVELSVA